MKKWSVKSILLVISIVCFLFIDKVNAASEVIYRIYDDSDGNKWQYAYIESENGEDYIEVSFFDMLDISVENKKIVIPSIEEFKSQNNEEIPSSVNKLVLVSYTEQELTDSTEIRKHTKFTNISEISLENVYDVEGIAPMIDVKKETKIIFPADGIIIGDKTLLEEKGAFEGAKLALVNLDKVTKIGVNAFKDATLQETDLDLKSLLIIDDSAFKNTNITSVKLNTPKIGFNAFSSCKKLKKVDIGNDVRLIDDGAFQGDSELVDIDFKNVTEVGNYSFSECTKFNIDISNTKFTTIGDAAFNETVGYNHRTTIPDGVTQLGYRVFYHSSIPEVNLNNVVEVGVQTFSNCINLSNINFGKTERILFQAFYGDKSLNIVNFTDTVEDIRTEAFMNCNIYMLNLNKVKSLCTRAFSGNNLIELYLPKSIITTKTISYNESSIFENNPLRKVTVAYDTMSTGMPIIFRAFLGNSYETVTDLILIAPYKDGDELLNDTKYNVRHGEYTNNYTSYGFEMDRAVEGGNANSYKNVIQANYFFGMTGLKHITIGEGYEFIGNQAFFVSCYGHSFYNDGGQSDEHNDTYHNIESVKLPSTLKGIGGMAFALNLTRDNIEFNLPEGLEYIGYQAFFQCTGLKLDLNIRSLKHIGDLSFSESGITNIYLHDKLKFVGKQAFFNTYKTSNVKNIIVDVDLYSLNNSGDCYGTNLEKLSNYHNFFMYIANKQEYNRIKFTDKVVTEPYDGFSNNQSSISPTYGFMLRIKAKEIDLGDTKWESLGSAAFQEASIGKLILPKNLKNIYNLVFYNSTINEKLIIPDSVTNINNQAFQHAYIKINKLPSKLQIIGNHAFFDSDVHPDLVIPETVTNIGNFAFGSSIFSDGRRFTRNSLTFNCNLTPEVTNNQTVDMLTINNHVDNLYFGEKVTELPTNTPGIGGSYPSEFYNTQVKNVVFKNLKKLPRGAFIQSETLESVDLGKSLTDIGDLAFFRVNLKEKLIIPNTVINIGAHALQHSDIKINQLPSKLQTIGDAAFLNSNVHPDLVVPETVTSIGTSAFGSQDYNPVYNDEDRRFTRNSLTFNCNLTPEVTHNQTVDMITVNNHVDNLYFGEKVTELPTNTPGIGGLYPSEFNNTQVKNVVFKNLKKLPRGAFIQSETLESVDLGKSLTDIGDLAFFDVNLKEKLIIPDTVINIGAHALQHSDIKINQLPSKLQTIGEAAFLDSNVHPDLVVPGTVTSIGQSAFGAHLYNPKYDDEDRSFTRNSLTFNCNLTPEVTNNQTVDMITANNHVDNLYFGEKVTELPTNTPGIGGSYPSEFNNTQVKNVVFKGLRKLPRGAFIESKTLESVDFSQDNDLTEIDELAFFKANKFRNIKFAKTDNSIKLGYSSFRDTGLTSIGGKDADFDLTSANFITDNFVFSENKNLEKVSIPVGFNNNKVSEFTFWNCNDLKDVSIDPNIETIKSYAFCGDSKLEKLFLWGDTKVEQDLTTFDPISESGPISIVNRSIKDDIYFNILVNGEIVKSFTSDELNGSVTRASTNPTYQFDGSGTVSFEYPDKSTYIEVNKLYAGGYNIIINDINPSNFTIPSNTDIYTYSKYDGNRYDDSFEEMRRNEELGTNSRVYALDEVLYLTSNHPVVDMNETEEDFDKSKLTVYALRRDGVIMESSTWGKFSKHYSRNNVNIDFEKYDEDTIKPDEIIYDYPFNVKNVDLSTENFDNMTFKIVTTNDFIQKKNIELFYTNDFLENSIVQTDILPKVNIIDIAETGDNIIKFIIMFVTSLVGTITVVIMLNKKQKKIV